MCFTSNFSANSQESFLDPRLWPERSYKIGSVRPSFRLFGHFLRIVSLVFSKFWYGARNPYEVVWICASQIWILQKKFLPQKLRKWTKNGPELSFFNVLKNLIINFYWICSLMKIYITFCVPTQISYLGKFLFLRYGPKYSQPIQLQDFLINHISRKSHWNA